MEQSDNPLLCNPENGACEIPGMAKTAADSSSTIAKNKPVKVIYFTDPICSSCWGIEPQLRKLKLEYGADVEIEYRMGGLLPDWSYNSGGISKPSDVAHHWDEVSKYYDMPIDGDVWLEDPLSSSYPPSIAFKAAQMQDNERALLFLREIREMVFLQKKNITKWEHLEAAAKTVGLDASQMQKDMESKAIELFQQDLALSRELGVRGFPTLFFSNTDGKKEMLYGSKPYAHFENILHNVFPNIEKTDYNKTAENIFAQYNTLTAREFAELMNIPRATSEATLNDLVNQGKIKKTLGPIWEKGK